MLFPESSPNGSAEDYLRAVFDPTGDDPEVSFQIKRLFRPVRPESKWLKDPAEVIGIATALALLQKDRLPNR